MRQFIKNVDELRTLVPNVIYEVDDEDSIFDKLKPHLDASASWLEQNIVDDSIVLGENATNFARRFVVNAAMAAAVPSLDLVLTPNGFGVVSTSEIAPASKDRVSSLVSSLNARATVNLTALVSELHHSEEWRESTEGQLFCSTLISYLDDIFVDAPDYLKAFDNFKRNVELAAIFEPLAANFTGSAFLSTAKHAYYTFGEDRNLPVFTILRKALRQFIYNYSNKPVAQVCPNHHEMWHLLEPVLNAIQLMQTVPPSWGEIPGLAQVLPFVNDVKGGYWF